MSYSALSALCSSCLGQSAPSAARRRIVWKGSGKRVVGYFSNWSQRRALGCQFEIDDIDGNLFTHVVYAYARIRPDLSDNPTFELAPAERGVRQEMTLRARAPSWNPPRGDMEPDGRYERLANLKKRYPHLKTLLAIGGRHPKDPPLDWSFPLLAENPESRRRFSQHAVAFLRAFRFEGMSLDWAETWLGERGFRPGDAQNFTALCREFKELARHEAQQSGKPELLLTMAAGPAQAKLLELEKLTQYLDWINLTAYDIHRDSTKRTHSLSPLHGISRATPEDVTRITQEFLARGVPRERLTLGMPTYARGWHGVDRPEPNSPAAGAGPEGRCTKDEGVITHGQMDRLLESGRFAAYWDEATKTPYAYDTQNRIWYGYDDVRSLGLKVDLIEREELGGAMFWAIDLDDFQNGYPLISSVSRRLRRSSAS